MDWCVQSEISYAIWDPDNRSQEQSDLLFVAVKHAVEPAFLNHLKTAWSENFETNCHGRGSCQIEAS